MKLADQHSCDAFQPDETATRSRSDLALARTLTIQCREAMQDIIVHILSLVEKLSTQMTDSTVTQACLAPWFLNCIYRAGVALSWIGYEKTPEELEKYAQAKTACVAILQLSNTRWKIAGMYLRLEFLPSHVPILAVSKQPELTWMAWPLGVYNEAMKSAEEDLKNGRY